MKRRINASFGQVGVALLGLVLSALITGCGVGDPLLITDEPEFVKLRESISQKAWHVEECEVRVEIGEEMGNEEWSIPVDVETLREGVQKALAGSGIFSAAAGENGGPSYPLNLSLKVVQAKGKFEGGNGNLLASIVLWMMSPLIACVVADEDYSVFLKVEATLKELGAEKPLWSAPIEGRVEESLDHFQRSLSIWDLVLPGPLVSSIGAEKVSEALGPHVYRKIELELVKRISEALPPPQIDLLVLYGAPAKGKGNEREKGEGLSGLEYCSEDAEAMGAVFEKRPGKFHVVRIEPTADAEKARSALKDIASRTDVRIRDFLFFYAGPGTLAVQNGKAEPALAFHEITVGGVSRRRYSILTVSDLLKLVKQIPAASHAVVIDSGFFGKGGRALPLPKGSAVDPWKIQGFPSGKGMPCLLCSCSPTESGGELPKQKHGVLTHFLLPLLAEGSDKKKDGAISAGEVFEDLSWGLSRQIRLLGGRAQHAHLSGDGVLWRYERRAPKKEEKPKKPAGSAAAKEDPSEKREGAKEK